MKRFYGPFKLLRAIGDVAFELELPPTSKIRPIFHVSQLNPNHGITQTALDLPPYFVDNQPIVVPLAVLDKKIQDGIQLVLIEWTDLYLKMIHGNHLEIKKLYPNIDLEDNVCANG